ncbi:dnaJ homolog subfamily C member 10-like [Cylas formicarius]|uniref:dnaJ homolog subfamily C member 10-like n=1 Tax=Cylas formicarius TaxID=197179 RepID=UPI002958D439|nr:dnaJ homolog subfamily C member 10-like [Cylas formicarius]
MNYLPYILFVILSLDILSDAKDEDYYTLLGVPRDATVQEIRKAFKLLAVKLHPDKNKEDEEAETKFVKIAKAYEILKDPTTRKQYDLYGDTEFKDKKHNYHSYTYYRDHFGIYDDDPLIVTLSKNDYELNVLDKTQAWFVNFYSPHCHHCHELAPVWRKLAQELEGVVRIGAVNCEEDYPLCYQLSIEAYPTLLYYQKEAHLYEGEKYRQTKTLETLKEYILSKLKVEIKEVRTKEWPVLNNQEWLLFLCPDDSLNCPEKETMTKLAAIFEGLLPVGVVKDSDLCHEILDSYKIQSVVFWQIVDKNIPEVHAIEGSDSKEILNKVLSIIPNPPVLDEKQFHDLRTKLRLGFEKPWLICFYLGAATDLNLQLKRLPTVIQNIHIGLINCGRHSGLCAALHIVRYPTWAVVKAGGAFEVHQGRDVLHEVAAFARDSSKSTNLHALSPADFINLKNDGAPWFVDWYAPWCPPCKRVAPELRKASLAFEPEVVQFGTVDCTLHRDLCFKEGIHSYPTLTLYNRSQTHRFQGTPSEETIVEFIRDTLNPIVVSLDENSFGRLARKSDKELWMVDFFAPWCGPCQKLAPEWRKLAKSVSDFKQVVIAQVDCVANSEMCDHQNIGGYPTIRLYPLGSKGLSSVAIYNGNRDHTSLKRWLLNFIPSKVEELTELQFREQILTRKYYLPWLVDFYAPWCGHCVHFEPEFRTVAQRLEGKVRAGKINCDAHRVFCGHQYVMGYPTVRLYISPNKFYNIEQQDGKKIIEKVKMLMEQNEKQNGIHDEL